MKQDYMSQADQLLENTKWHWPKRYRNYAKMHFSTSWVKANEVLV